MFLMTITPETEFVELGPEQYQVINPCKLSNLQLLVAVLGRGILSGW